MSVQNSVDCASVQSQLTPKKQTNKIKNKRGSSGLSFMCGVYKPVGLTSHDIVNRVRKIFGERRVGHAGTLDPAASGVMLMFVGPATRLSNYLIEHDKRYIARIQFGASTDTCDAQGKITEMRDVPACVTNENFAHDYVAGLKGVQKQLPPVYSALKVNGKKACDEARRGNIINLEARDIEVYDAKLLKIGHLGANAEQSDDRTNLQEGLCDLGSSLNSDMCFDLLDGKPFWDVEFHVSSGTYIRALARDMGLGVGSVAHLSALERISLSSLSIHDCVSLDVLERERVAACVDPINLLGMQVAFVGDDTATKVSNGLFLPQSTQLCEFNNDRLNPNSCICTTGARVSDAIPQNGEKIAVVSGNKLLAIYFYEENLRKFKPDCVFSEGVLRGLCT